MAHRWQHERLDGSGVCQAHLAGRDNSAKWTLTDVFQGRSAEIKRNGEKAI